MAQWAEIPPSAPLSQLTVGDLFDAIGWAITHYKAAEQGDREAGFHFEGTKPMMPVFREHKAAVMGWKEAQHWGSWKSNWWGVRIK